MSEQASKLKKNIIPFAIIILAAASIYGLPYFRYSYTETFKQVYSLTDAQFGNLQAAYGIVAAASYIIGGWLADRFSVKSLLIFSFVGTGATGLYLLTIPSYQVLLLIHGFWGVTTIMTFWPAFIKAVRSLGNENEQGRLFGLMEGVRGVYNIILASIPVAIFAVYEKAGDIETGMLRVVLYYGAFLIIVGALTMVFLKEPPKEENEKTVKPTFKTVKNILKKPSVWLISGIIFCSYFMNIAFYNFNPYAENFMMIRASLAALFIVMAQYIRPLAATTSGFIGNKIGISKTVIAGFIVMIIGVAIIVFLPVNKSSTYIFTFALILIFFGMYALQGNHFALLSEGDISEHETGTAVGIISTIGYLPETLAPLTFSLFGTIFGGKEIIDGSEVMVQTVASHKAYDIFLIAIFALGIVFALIFKRIYLDKNKSKA